jgi:hypothetical protein
MIQIVDTHCGISWPLLANLIRTWFPFILTRALDCCKIYCICRSPDFMQQGISWSPLIDYLIRIDHLFPPQLERWNGMECFGWCMIPHLTGMHDSRDPQHWRNPRNEGISVAIWGRGNLVLQTLQCWHTTETVTRRPISLLHWHCYTCPNITKASLK